MMFLLRCMIVTLAFVTLWVSEPVVATQINLDVQKHTTEDANGTGTDAFNTAGADGVVSLQNINHVWNYLDYRDSLTKALVDVDNNPTGVTFEFVTTALGGGTRSNPPSPPFNDDVARDEVHNDNGAGALTLDVRLTGLMTDGTTYDLYVIAANLYNTQESGITVGGTTQNIVPVAAYKTPDLGPLVENEHYTVFGGVVPNGSGVIDISMEDISGDPTKVYFSGLQIVSHAVPEPASLSLFGLSCLVCLVSRNRF